MWWISAIGVGVGLGLGFLATRLSKSGGTAPKVLSVLGYSITFLSVVSFFL